MGLLSGLLLGGLGLGGGLGGGIPGLGDLLKQGLMSGMGLGTGLQSGPMSTARDAMGPIGAGRNALNMMPPMDFGRDALQRFGPGPMPNAMPSPAQMGAFGRGIDMNTGAMSNLNSQAMVMNPGDANHTPMFMNKAGPQIPLPAAGANMNAFGPKPNMNQFKMPDVSSAKMKPPAPGMAPLQKTQPAMGAKRPTPMQSPSLMGARQAMMNGRGPQLPGAGPAQRMQAGRAGRFARPGPVGNPAKRVQQAQSMQNKVFNTASKYKGMHEVRQRDTLKAFFKKAGGMGIDPSKTAWCAEFANSVLKANGQKGTGSLMAKSFLKYGTPTNNPTKGDIAVFNRGKDPRFGHVGFYAGKDKHGNILVLGGNQNNMVNIKAYPAHRLAGFRRIAP